MGSARLLDLRLLSVVCCVVVLLTAGVVAAARCCSLWLCPHTSSRHQRTSAPAGQQAGSQEDINKEYKAAVSVCFFCVMTVQGEKTRFAQKEEFVATNVLKRTSAGMGAPRILPAPDRMTAMTP